MPFSHLLTRILFRLHREMEKINRRHSLHGDAAFFSPEDFPWTAQVAERTPAIREELLSLLPTVEKLPNFQDISPDQAILTTDARWKTYFFAGYGVESAANRKRCPQTSAALDLIPGMTTACFSILAPGKVLPPHRGPYNGVLRYHLGLRIPASDESCGIRVGGTTRHWAEGQALIFDDTYEHQAWNRTPHWRVVLFVDFLRPLPLVPNLLNRTMMAIIRRTPFVRVAARNQERWETDFYG
ncbi:MAG: aspartyl/asparaginyl beta-hydroxylase domain-containing protein [Gammaproteobacteria bacterium]|nr:aspartyl/asparaginyl beta-hydroxylase domain-containing protein [Gammaproteobacteria bacterium]MBU1442069.1 aspartyl/asparaginyl beta-hydroxylase domain-containing protein [Gammaproteobacteria bacterium]MBU2285168.1 aspartyl/asparaginyl beta-hydroxylase domain-containing protein [Gammaproteobacteria bacterium]MBU2409308.1 aspartyl/asparaginyl beta-hydroxylase domain-containing protein [Gammaproteobacteria bacterium]